MLFQRTLKQLISASGVGLHSGLKVTLSMRPAPANTGIVFRRVDLDSPVEIPADAHCVADTVLCSALKKGNVKIGTVEHIMSALCGMGIDNLYVDLDAPELPIFDGSAAPFVFLIQNAGIEEQKALKKFIRIKEKVEVQDGDKWARFEPFDGCSLQFSIVFNHPVIDRSATLATMNFAHDSYVKDISRARTFGFMHEVEFLRENGLALGGGLENAIVLDEYRVLNPDGLRYPDEFVRHKILDALGDLYLAGHPFLAAYSSHKGGHALNNQLVRKLLANESAFEIIEFQETPPQSLKSWFFTPATI